jgi:hypothetical protein
VVLQLSPMESMVSLCGTANGKQKRAYRWYATPWEILRQLPGRPDSCGRIYRWSN